MPPISRERLTGFITGVAVVGFLLSAWLVISEVFREPTCPDLLGVPACFVVLAGYAAAAVGAWFEERGDAVFLVGATVVTVVGVIFTQGQVRGTAACPTFEGLPMCYLSLAAGVVMLATHQVRRSLER